MNLPHNQDAEQALLGAILLNNAALDAVSGFLQPGHFHYPAHGRIYEACLKLVEQGRRADPITLRARFEADGDLSQIGGTRYLIELAEQMTVPSSAKDYGLAIIEAWRRRQAIAVGEKLARAGRQGPVDTKLVEDAQDALGVLSGEPEEDDGPVPLSFAFNRALEHSSAVFQANGAPLGIRFGIPEADRILAGLMPEDFMILAGRPSMGKTALGLQFAFSTARNVGPVGFWSLEMPKDQLSRRILAGDTGIGADRQRGGPLDRQEFHRLFEASQANASVPLHIDDKGDLGIAEIRLRARKLARKHGLALIVVDYLQLIRYPDRMSQVEALTEITRGLKLMAKDLGVPVCCLAQLSRDLLSREDKRPQLGDLRGSGTIEQDADQVVFIHRPEMYLTEPTQREKESQEQFAARATAHHQQAQQMEGLVELIVAKNRHGPTGIARTTWDGVRQAIGAGTEADLRQEVLV